MKIPKKYLNRVELAEHDQDGWWIYLKDRWNCDTSAAPHTIHEDSQNTCLRCLRESYENKADAGW